MNKCLVTKLQAVVNNDNLDLFESETELLLKYDPNVHGVNYPQLMVSFYSNEGNAKLISIGGKVIFDETRGVLTGDRKELSLFNVYENRYLLGSSNDDKRVYWYINPINPNKVAYAKITDIRGVYSLDKVQAIINIEQLKHCMYIKECTGNLENTGFGSINNLVEGLIDNGRNYLSNPKLKFTGQFLRTCTLNNNKVGARDIYITFTETGATIADNSEETNVIATYDKTSRTWSY